jgi:hypothetical protein
MINYGYAYYYLGIKEYQKALKSINNISLDKFVYRFNIRNIELRIYYELNKIELLLDALHNYRLTILNNELLTSSDKKSLLKMITYFKKLILIKNELDIKKQISEARVYIKLIEKEPVFSLKKYLMDKYDAIAQIGSVKETAVNNYKAG